MIRGFADMFTDWARDISAEFDDAAERIVARLAALGGSGAPA